MAKGAHAIQQIEGIVTSDGTPGNTVCLSKIGRWSKGSGINSNNEEGNLNF